MEAKEYKIINILTENKKFIIPSYQRPYSWDKTHTEELLDDICDSFSSDNREYFIGTLICIERDDFIYEVVDGQQRLTTLSLIFAKMKDLIKSQDKASAKENLTKRVLQVDDFSGGAQESRLKVRSTEYDLYYNYILQNDGRFLPDSPSYTEKLYIDNFDFIESYFYDRFQSDEQQLCALAKHILERVYVVFVKTDDLVSSFRLFNVLNTRGLELSAADLIKNNLFEVAEMNNVSHKKIESYWQKIEKIVGVEKFDKFLRFNQVSLKKDRDRANRELFIEYSDILNKEYSGNSMEFVVDLLKSAENYERIRNPKSFNDIKSRKILSSLNRLPDEWIPSILSFLNRMRSDKSLNDRRFQKFIEIFEKCYMQSWFRQHIKSKRESIVYSALVAINNRQDFQSIINSIVRHADNQEFIEALSQKIYEPYSGKVNFIKAVLLRIDQNIQDESVFKEYEGKISIEHILPQSASDIYWQEKFSDESRNYWLHRLGNLTLISGSKNSKASNSSFDMKKEKYNTPSKSLDITREICEYAEWTPETVKKHHSKIIERAKSIWLL